MECVVIELVPVDAVRSDERERISEERRDVNRDGVLKDRFEIDGGMLRWPLVLSNFDCFSNAISFSKA